MMHSRRQCSQVVSVSPAIDEPRHATGGPVLPIRSPWRKRVLHAPRVDLHHAPRQKRVLLAPRAHLRRATLQSAGAAPRVTRSLVSARRGGIEGMSLPTSRWATGLTTGRTPSSGPGAGGSVMAARRRRRNNLKLMMSRCIFLTGRMCLSRRTSTRCVRRFVHVRVCACVHLSSVLFHFVPFSIIFFHARLPCSARIARRVRRTVHPHILDHPPSRSLMVPHNKNQQVGMRLRHLDADKVVIL
jgi:hypothetical protein